LGCCSTSRKKQGMEKAQGGRSSSLVCLRIDGAEAQMRSRSTANSFGDERAEKDLENLQQRPISPFHWVSHFKGKGENGERAGYKQKSSHDGKDLSKKKTKAPSVQTEKHLTSYMAVIKGGWGERNKSALEMSATGRRKRSRGGWEPVGQLRQGLQEWKRKRNRRNWAQKTKE